MAGFGDVLRGLGSVLNPQVNQDVEGEYQKRQAQQQAMQQFALGQLVKGVESGAIAPERLPEGLRGMVGVSPEAQKRIEALKRESEMRTRLAAAQTPEARRAIAMEYASPDALARMPVADKRISVAPGNSVIDDSGNVIYSAPDRPEKPEKPAYKERKVSYDGSTYTTEVSLDGGGTWEPIKGAKPVDIRSATGASNITQTIVPPSKVFESENKLRDDYTTASKPFVGVRDAYNTIRASLSGPITAVSTLAGATKFMKMIDPESVVRESELQMALKATGMLDRFMNLHNVVMKGNVLTPNQAAEIKGIAETLYNAAEKQQETTNQYYSGLATEYGLKPERVVRKQGSVMRAPSTTNTRHPLPDLRLTKKAIANADRYQSADRRNRRSH